MIVGCARQAGRRRSTWVEFLQARRFMPSAKTTINHEIIQQWVEERGGTPAQVKGTGSQDEPGLLRIDYPGFSGEESLEPIEWQTFFEAFEANELAFLYQDKRNSRFSKFISRGDMSDESAEAPEAEEATEEAASDAIELLESQHREVELLFAQLRETSDSEEREELFAQLADNLAAHAKIEEDLFYPAVCADQTSDQLHEAVDEHFDVKQLLAEMMEMDVDDEQFATKLDELERMVQHHVEDEENKLFVQVRERELVDLEALAPKLEEEFAELMQAHPSEQIPDELDGPAELPC